MNMFHKGDRLKASDLNELIRSNMSPRNAFVQNSNLYRGQLQLRDDNLRMVSTVGRGWDKPFDIYCGYDKESHELSSYTLYNCKWHDGAEIRQINSDDGGFTAKIEGDDVADVSEINLCELSSIGSESEQQSYGGLLKQTSEGISQWKILSDLDIEEYPKDGLSVVSKFRLYDVENGLVKLDWRDAFVQTGDLSASPTNSEYHLDLSSLNEVSAVVSGETRLLIQNWNYKDPKDEDLSFVDILGLDQEASASLWDYQFLARPRDGGTLKYLSLSCEISALSAELSCKCKLTPILDEGTKIAEWEGCDGNKVDIFAPTGGGGGECSCEVSAIHPRFDKDHRGQTQQYWENAKVGQFTDCKGDKTMLYAPNHIQFKGNAGSSPFLSNLSDYFELTSETDSNIRIRCDGQTITIAAYYT